MSLENLFKEFSNAPLTKLFLMLLVFSILACPGVLWLVVFKPEIFREIETAKMLMLSAAFSIPIFITNIFVGIDLWFNEYIDMRHREVKKASGIEDTTPSDPEDIIETGAIIGAVASLPPLYVPVLIRIFTSAFTFRAAIATALVLEIIVLAGMLYYGRRIWWRRFREARRELDELRTREGRLP